jgi:hypothetical protein
MKKREIIILVLAIFVSFTFSCSMNKEQQIDVAAYYWPAYHDDPRFSEMGIFKEGKGEWEVIYNAVPKFEGHDQPLVPVWGYEDESDPAVVAKKIDVAVSYGVNVWAVDWYWYEGRPFLQGFLDNGLLKAPNKDKMKFYLMWANHDMNAYLDQKAHKKDSIFFYGGVDKAMFDKISDMWISYFKEPNYYKIDGKPVFSLYLLDTFIKGIGGVENAKTALELFRNKTVAAGFPGLHLQAIIHEWVPEKLEGVDSMNSQNDVLKYFGFNSITNYQWIHYVPIKPRQDYTEYAREAVKQFDKYGSDFTIPYFPHVSVGWDCNARFPNDDPDPSVPPKELYPNIMDKGVQNTVVNRSPVAFKEALKKAKEYLKKHPDQPQIISINSWNEWSEGSYLEPDTKRGFAYLEAVKDVFLKKDEK